MYSAVCFPQFVIFEKFSVYDFEQSGVKGLIFFLSICRQIITVRLQQMMKSHCEEAIKLLNSSTTKLPPLSETRQVFESVLLTINGLLTLAL